MANILQEWCILSVTLNDGILLQFCYIIVVAIRENRAMFNTLPEAVKQQVLYLLSHDDFKAAKDIYDQWLQQNSQSTASCTATFA